MDFDFDTESQSYYSYNFSESDTQSVILQKRRQIQRIQKLYEFAQVMDYLDALGRLFDFIGQKIGENDLIRSQNIERDIHHMQYDIVILQEQRLIKWKEEMNIYNGLCEEFILSKNKLAALEEEHQTLLDMKTISLQRDFQMLSFNRMQQNSIEVQKKLNREAQKSLQDDKQIFEDLEVFEPIQFMGEDGLECKIEQNRIQLKLDGELFLMEFDEETGEWGITSGQVNANRVMNQYNIHKNIRMLIQSLKLLVEQNRLKLPYF